MVFFSRKWPLFLGGRDEIRFYDAMIPSSTSIDHPQTIRRYDSIQS